MSYLKIDSAQGEVVVDYDRIAGAGRADSTIVVLIVSGSAPVDINTRDADQADKLIEVVKDIIVKRKVRTPQKPIEV